jgi:heme exporter protein B
MKFFGKVFTIAVKDLLSEVRARKLTPAMIVFSLIVIIIFNFVFEPGLQKVETIGPGILWVAFSFAGMMGLARSFSSEQEQGALRGLMLAPVDRSAIYLGKLISNLIFLFGIELISLLVFSVFFNIDIFRFLPALGVVLGIATLGFVSIGTLYSAMVLNIRLREVFLPVLLFPIMIPVMIGVVQLTAQVLQGNRLSESGKWLGLLAAYDVIFLTVGLMTFEFVVGE